MKGTSSIQMAPKQTTTTYSMGLIQVDTPILL
jgi:hypothetical protein